MLENTLVVTFIFLLLLTTKRRNYLGLVVGSYYLLFIASDLNYFTTFTEWVNTSGQTYYASLGALSCLYAIVSSELYRRGSNVAGFYSSWLILNAASCFILANFYNDNAARIFYNGVQNLNLFIDLAVVLLGTDNVIKRNRYGGRYIKAFNDRAFGVFDLGFSDRRKISKGS